MALEQRSDEELARVIENHERGLAAAKAEQKRRGTKAAKTYGQRVAERFIEPRYEQVIVWNVARTQGAVLRPTGEDTGAALAESVASHVDAARADLDAKWKQAIRSILFGGDLPSDVDYVELAKEVQKARDTYWQNARAAAFKDAADYVEGALPNFKSAAAMIRGMK